MQFTRRAFIVGISTSAASLLLAACGTRSTATAPPPSPTTAARGGSATPASSAAATPATTGGPLTKVRVGYVPAAVFAPVFVAADKGYYRAQGLDVELLPFAGGADILTQTAGGNLEVGPGGLGAAALNAFRRGLDVRIVASQHSERPPLATPLVVGKKKYDDGTYRKVADLKGKKVSVNARGTGTEYWLYLALKQANLTFKDVEVVALPFDQVGAGLDSGAIDGGMLGEPLVTLAEQKNLVTRLSDDFLKEAQGTFIYYNLKWAQANQETAGRWLAAWMLAARDLNNGGYARDENAAIVEKWTKTPKDVVKVARPPFHDPNGAVNLDDLKAQQEFFLTTGALSYTDPLDLTTVIDSSYAQRAVAIVGKG